MRLETAHTIHTILPELCLIELCPPLAGFDRFIGAWLYRGQGTCLVDVGPAVTASRLLAALRVQGVNHLDAIYLTHIHIDHAGAIGEISAAFPETPIVVHPKGIAHLVDPTRLWEGTLKTLADTARAYGPFTAVPSARLVAAEGPVPGPLEALVTPGHAPHHVSYLGEPGLFVGEAGGVRLDLPGGEVYLRPATPPRFFPETYLASLSRVADQAADRLLYGHFGATADRAWLSRHGDQLRLWLEIVEQAWAAGDGDGAELVDDCLARLLTEDAHLAGFERMAPDARRRERGFLVNSIRGMLGHMAARDDA